MITVTFVLGDQTRMDVQCRTGRSLMKAAHEGGVPGIDAMCGGDLACGTCRVDVKPEWFDRAGSRGELEEMLLDLGGLKTPGSRLSCQVLLTRGLNGLEVEVPPTQR
ncbi:MAG: hypothetical protein RL702_1898 [Pseudomonadota bacterium]|jgi:2Fe-2S ferredoxin